jgi:hypothetical protein
MILSLVIRVLTFFIIYIEHLIFFRFLILSFSCFVLFSLDILNIQYICQRLSIWCSYFLLEILDSLMGCDLGNQWKICKWKLKMSTTLHANTREVCSAYWYFTPIFIVCAYMTHSLWENPTSVQSYFITLPNFVFISV